MKHRRILMGIIIVELILTVSMLVVLVKGIGGVPAANESERYTEEQTVNAVRTVTESEMPYHDSGQEQHEKNASVDSEYGRNEGKMASEQTEALQMDENGVSEKINLSNCPAGQIVEKEKAADLNLDALFQTYEIGDEVLLRIQGKSYVENPDITLEQLRYLKVLHYNYNHELQVGEVIVNAVLAEEFREIFMELYEAEYEIESLYLIDNYWTGDGDGSDTASINANNTSAFCYRTVTGSSALSNHALGCAIDINPKQNPYITFRDGESVWFHEDAEEYLDRTSGKAHMITEDDTCYRIFTEHGFTWGGSWSSPKDYQHFERKLTQEEQTAFEQMKGKTKEQTKEQMEKELAELSVEEKAAQLFMITPEALTGISGVTAAGDTTRAAIARCPVGGLVYFRENILSEEQFSEMASNVQKYSLERIGLPMLIGVDEEGGTVRRISGRGFERVPDEPDMYGIGNSRDEKLAYRTLSDIGAYLKRFGFNVDFAPVADVWSNPDNTVIGTRSFGNDPKLTAKMTAEAVRGLREQGICATLKHFPGHGDTAQDSHSGIAVSYKTLDELRACEFLPFQAGMEAGAELVMIGHISLPNVTGDDTPATLSYQIITEILRGELGFEGVVITDAMNMGAVANRYGSGEAAVRAILAGADMILMPADFYTAWNSVVQAVYDGRISEERLNQSVERIFMLKKTL